MNSSSRSALKSFDRKNAHRHRCFSAGCDLVTRALRAEIEADDFSQFPSLAYAKGFLLIYGKFLDVDVTPYLDAFEDSERVTVDGYSYLQENRPQKPVSAPVVPRRPVSSGRYRVSAMPLIVGIVVLVIGFLL